MVYMCLYSCCPTCSTLSIWGSIPFRRWTLDSVCIYRSHWSHNSQSDFLSTVARSSRTVSFFFINWQWTVVPRAPCQRDRDATPALLLGVLSLTPVTQGTWGRQVVLEEHVNQMANGQGVIQLVHVSPHYVISYHLHTDYNHAKELLVFLVYTTIHSIS